jgi:hypothetical protein
MAPMSLTKLIASLAPLLLAVLTQAGIEVQEAQVETWINVALWVIALAATLFPSFRAWLNHREEAE